MEDDVRPSKRRRTNGTNPSEDMLKGFFGLNGDLASDPILETTDTCDHNSDAQAANPEDSSPTREDVVSTSVTLERTAFDPPLSKNQLKKLRKKQEWESKREERKILRKQKDKEKRQRKRERFKEAAENEESPRNHPERPSTRKATQLPITILIDCDFDDLMLDNERISLAGQITRCYSDNRRAPFRAHLGVCSFNGKLRKRFDEVLTHHKGWKDVQFLDCDFVEASERAKDWMKSAKGGTLAGAFSTLATDVEANESQLDSDGEIVYLTSESNFTLTELRPFSTYIIGGLVDKNREKGICYKRATKRGVKTAKLPIGQFMDMQSRKVLATNHVNELMLKWLECGDWGQAFLKVIPKRKGGKLKNSAKEDEDDEVKVSEVGRADSDSPSQGGDETEDDVKEDVRDVS